MTDSDKNVKGDDGRKSTTALLLVDVINDLEFEGAAELASNILPLTKNIAALKNRAKEAGIPVIYVNDNFGKWQSDFRKLLDHCMNEQVRGTPLAVALRPDEDDYFVLKPRHSAFYSTTLEVLLDYLGAQTLIIAGVTTDLCILFTASDAHMRNYRLIIPSDCVAAENTRINDYAIEIMKLRLGADVAVSSELDLKAIRDSGDGKHKPHLEAKSHRATGK